MQKVFYCLLELAYYKYNSHNICKDLGDHITLNLCTRIKNRYKVY